MSAVPPKISLTELQQKFIAIILTKISWTNHLEILSQTALKYVKLFIFGWKKDGGEEEGFYAFKNEKNEKI